MKGVTLIELIVVVAIIGILASVVLASLHSSREKKQELQNNPYTQCIERCEIRCENYK